VWPATLESSDPTGIASASPVGSPAATELLKLGETRHTGAVRLADVTIELRAGRIVAVLGGGIEMLGDFLVRTGRIEKATLDAAKKNAEEREVSVADALRTRSGLGTAALSEARRSLYAERIARVLGSAIAVESGEPEAAGTGEDLARTVLAAVAIAVGTGASASLAARAGDRFVPTDALRRLRGPIVDALGPAAFPPEGATTVAEILDRGPEAARGLAVVLEAGLATLAEAPPKSKGPPPLPSRPKTPPPLPAVQAPKAAATPPPLPSAPKPSAASPPPLPPPTPRRPTPVRGTIKPTIDLASPPVPTAPEDPSPRYTGPFEPLGDAIAEMEAETAALAVDAAPRERAELLLRRGEAWERLLGSVEEACLAYREAAAADPTMPEAIARARAACERVGDSLAAVAYLKVEISLATEPAARADLLARLGRLLGMAGDRLGAAHALRLALEMAPDHDEASAGLADASEPADGAILHADRARRHLAAGRTADALRAVRAALEADPRSDAALGVAEEVFPAAGRPTEHERALRAAMAGGEAAWRGLLLRRLGALGERTPGRRDLALEGYGVALAIAPDDAEAAAGLRRVLSAAGRHGELADWLEAEAARHEGAARTSLLRELAALAGGPLADPERAAEIWVRILGVSPQDAEALAAVEAHFGGRRDSVGLLDAYARSTSSEAWSDPTARVERLVLQAKLAEEKLGAVHRAKTALEQALAIDPASAAAVEGLARLVSKVKLQDNLRQIAEKEATSTEPEKRIQAVRKLAGLLKDHPDDWPRAVEVHKELLALAPGDPAGVLALGRLTDQMGDVDGSIWLLRHRLAHTEHRAERLRALKRLARLLGDGDAKAAADAWREVVSLEPSNLEARRRLERATAALDDPEELVRLLGERADAARAKGDKEGSAEALSERARMLQGRLSDPARAAETWKKLLEVVPDDPRASWGWATALEAAGDAPGAALAAAKLVASPAGKDDPESLRLLARACTAVGDVAGEQKARGALAALRPTDGAAAAAWLDAAHRAEDDAGIENAALRVLGAGADPRGVRELVRRTVRRFAAGRPESAARIATRFLDEGGSPDADLAFDLARLADARGDGRAAAVALERALPGSDRDRRLSALREIAARWRKAGDVVGEIRTQLRVLSLDSADPSALESLEQAYTRAGDGQRLLAVLELRVASERARSAPKTTLSDLFVRMAAVARDVNGDKDECLALFECARAETPDDPKVLVAIEARLFADHKHALLADHLEGRAAASNGAAASELYQRAALVRETLVMDLPGALRDVRAALERDSTDVGAVGSAERLAARTGDVVSMTAIFRMLVERTAGVHGARAMAYRGARFLEALGKKSEALGEYASIFNGEPRTGAVLAAVERLSLEIGDHRPLVFAWRRIAEASRDLGTRTAAYRRAAEIAEAELGDRPAAMELLLTAYSEFADPDVEAGMRRIAREIASSDPDAGPAVFERILKAFKVRAERAFDGEEGARWLQKAAIVSEEDRDDLEGAFAFVAKGVESAPDAEMDLSPELERLAARCGLWAQVAQTYEHIIAKTLDPVVAVKCLLALARVEEEELDRPEAEGRLRRVLSMRKGGEEEARTALERLLRKRERWSDLVALLEELAAGMDALARAAALAEVATIWEEKLGNVREAIGVLERIRDAAPEATDASSDGSSDVSSAKLASLYTRAGEHRKVAGLLREQAARVSDPAEARRLTLRRAQVLEHDAGDPDEALDAYQSILAESPQDVEARAGAERAAEASGRTTELSVLLAERARSTGTAERFDVVAREVEVLVAAARATEALGRAREYRAQVQADPEVDDRVRRGARDLVVRAAMASAQPEAMAEAYGLLIEAAPSGSERAAARRRRAAILVGLAGREADAIEEITAAAAESPEDASGLEESALLSEKLGRRDLAASLLAAAAATAKDGAHGAELFVRAGDIHREAGERDLAAQRYRAALERSAGHPAALKALVELEGAAGNVQAVESYAGRILEGTDGSADGMDSLVAAARALLDSGNPSRALEVALKAREKDVRRADAAAIEAIARSRAGLLDSPEAWRSLEASLVPATQAGDPEDLAVLHLSLADAKVALGDVPGAARVLEGAERRIGAQGLVAVGLAERLVAAGDEAGALVFYERALERPAFRGLRAVASVRLAAGLAAVAAGDEGRATGYLLGAMAEDAGVTVRARRALADLRIAQGDAARATMELTKLADGQAGADRGRTLRELGQTLALALGDLPGAVSVLEEAIGILPAGTDEGRGAAEDLLDLYSNVENWPAAVQLAQNLARTGDGPARSRFHLSAAEALAALGQEDGALEELRLAREADPTNPRVAAQIERALEGRGEVRQLLKDLAVRLAGDLPKEERARILFRMGELRAEGNNDPAGASAAFEEALRLGNLDAGERLAALLEAHPDRVFDALAVHRKILAADPARVGSLRSLHRVYTGLGTGPEAAAVASVLRLFDKSVPDPGDPPRLEDLRAPPEGALEALRPAGLGPLLERFALVWEGGYPLFRRDLPAFGVSGADRVSPLAETPLAKVYAGGIRVLGLAKTPLFVRLAGSGSVEVAATYPPAVIVGPALRPDTPEGRFQVGRAVEATRPALVLAAVLVGDRARTLFEATLGAFGPPPAADAPPIAKESADLAASLWKTLPPRTQRRLQEICAKGVTDADAQTWLRLVRQSMNRAGLLVCGDTAASLRVVAAETPELSGVDVATEHGFREAVRRSPEFADLAAFAVSDEYLALRWRADVGRPR